MAIKSPNIKDREHQKFVESPTRPEQTAVEVIVGNNSAIPVSFTQGTPIIEYGSISSLASGTLTTVLSYTVPVGMTLSLEKVEVSGCNVADFLVDIGATVKGKRRTYYGSFNSDFEYKGFQVATGTEVRVRVIHSSALAGDFDATLIGSVL